MKRVLMLSCILTLGCDDDETGESEAEAEAEAEAESEAEAEAEAESEAEAEAEAEAEGELRWYENYCCPVEPCDPAPCEGDNTDVSSCTDEDVGEVCTDEGAQCDPRDNCPTTLICRASPFKCASRRRLKDDISYLGAGDIERIYQELRAVKLATWRYKREPNGPRRLGFIIDDHPSLSAVASDGEHVDLYGFVSMAAAAIQAQALQIDALERELNLLRKDMAKR